MEKVYPIGFYQDQDNFIDYQLHYRPELNTFVRNPYPNSLDDNQFFCCLGAAQTFGRFCLRPYPTLLCEDIKLPCLNLGRGGVGPTYFSQNQKFIDAANKAKFVIVQVMSGRSLNNSLFVDSQGINQFLTPFFGEQRVLSGVAWKYIFDNFSKEYLKSLVTETRRCWIEETIHLLKLIEKPKILLFFSRRKPDYTESWNNLQKVWGDFPQLINSGMLQEILPYSDFYLEVVTHRGSPQKLPVSISLGIDGKKRNFNNYYPSPEMHIDAFEVLKEFILKSGLLEHQYITCQNNSLLKSFLNKKSFFFNITKKWMYPNLLKFTSGLDKKSCIVCDTSERIILQNSTQSQALITSYENFLEVVKREEVNKIFVFSLDNESEYKQSICSQIKTELGKTLPIYGYFADVLTALSLRNSLYSTPTFTTGEKLAITKYMIVCTPRTGSTVICDLLKQTKQLGYPTEHLTIPIVNSVERNKLNLETWLRLLVDSNLTPNNVFGTKFIIQRLHRLLQTEQKEVLHDHLQKFKVIRLHRNLLEQAVSSYIGQITNKWHTTVAEKTENKDLPEINYNYLAISAIYKDYLEQEAIIDNVISHLEIKSDNICHIHYENLLSNPSNLFKSISNLLEVEIGNISLELSSSKYVRSNQEIKKYFLKLFNQEISQG